MEPLNVLVVESERDAAAYAVDSLTAAGHTIVRCHEAGKPAFPCNAIVEGRKCPLEASIVDVVLDVRPRPRSQPSPLEDGVTCALRQHVPVVVAGSPVLNPFADYATAVVERDADLVGACERAAHTPLRRHTEAATVAMSDVLRRRAVSISPIVRVVRHAGALRIEVQGATALDESTKSMAAVRMCAAVRELDRHARGVDVAFIHH
jgi:hypothetical protein